MESQKISKNYNEMSQELRDYRLKLLESIRQKINRDFRGFPYQTKFYNLNKSQLFTLCCMLNTIGLKQDLPTKNKTITVIADHV